MIGILAKFAVVAALVTPTVGIGTELVLAPQGQDQDSVYCGGVDTCILSVYHQTPAEGGAYIAQCTGSCNNGAACSPPTATPNGPRTDYQCECGEGVVPDVCCESLVTIGAGAITPICKKKRCNNPCNVFPEPPPSGWVFNVCVCP